jgi:hypothetical protein
MEIFRSGINIPYPNICFLGVADRFDVDPDPAFNFDADLDSAPDPDPDMNPRN